MRELLMQHDRTLDKIPFRVPLQIHERRPEENFFRTIINMNQDQRTSIKTNIHPKKGPHKPIITRPLKKMKSTRFDDPYDHINHM